MKALAFLAVFATVHFVAPFAAPSFAPTIIQSAAITVLAFVARALLTAKDEYTLFIYEKEDD
ncbi:hypothetical protein [Bacillus sp. 03113]|uniref:hypothetical protein n=1 Tax=Bacillus sp. 03113 TaxID=2578211 RepID=UPI0015E8EB77|nr:hypothetical protein [Bacillus sp. 03113]